MIERLKLNNGLAIPALGLNTWLVENARAESLVSQALKLGYRHIDTAQAYGNEVGVGKGLFISGLPREEIYVASKMTAEHQNYELAVASIDDSLRKLGLDYLDLMLVHCSQVGSGNASTHKVANHLEVWRALEDAHSAGKIKSIGLSCFLMDDLKTIEKHARIKPAVNQILTHIGNTPLELISYCQQKAIVLEAYSPIVYEQALQSPEIKEMANHYHVTPAQLCIQYVLQLGMVALPKTENPQHMISNQQLDFKISKKDMAILKALDFKVDGNNSQKRFFTANNK